MELERGCGIDTWAFRLDRAEAGVKVPEKILWTILPLRVANVLGKVTIPEPEDLTRFGDLLWDMRGEDGGLTLATFLQTLGTLNTFIYIYIC